MFYVHLFLKAMYRKKKKIIFFVFPNICIHLATLKQKAICITRETYRSSAGPNQTLQLEVSPRRAYWLAAYWEHH